MKERSWGRIVNMASVAGTLGGFGQASYSTTKSGILGLTKTLAMEGGRHGITCNAIVPGIIGTEAFHMANAVMNERIAARTVFKRPATADIATRSLNVSGPSLSSPASSCKCRAGSSFACMSGFRRAPHPTTHCEFCAQVRADGRGAGPVVKNHPIR